MAPISERCPRMLRRPRRVGPPMGGRDQAWARRCVWERLAIECEHLRALGALEDEAENEADRRRLTRAVQQVHRTILARVQKMKAAEARRR